MLNWKKFTIRALTVTIVVIAGCSKTSDKASSVVVNPEITVNAADLVKNGNLYFPDDFSQVIGTTDTTIIDNLKEVTASAVDEDVIRTIVLLDGTEYRLIHPVIDLGNTGTISPEDEKNLRQLAPSAIALGGNITNYYLKDNEWVYAVIMGSSDQAWVYYNPRKAGYKTLKFKNNIVWNYEVLMLPSWRNASSGWNQWTAWWCAPWYTFKTLYSGSADIAYLFVVVQNNDKSASVMMTAY
ncbi:MAG: hypothetical protein HZC01_02595 [Candidatus Kerfeldbacteria bacterium]|nr:hypothetical protein [Candidatus Kerfeldbacteria bacterium]